MHASTHREGGRSDIMKKRRGACFSLKLRLYTQFLFMVLAHVHWSCWKHYGFQLGAFSCKDLRFYVNGVLVQCPIHLTVGHLHP